MLATGLITGVAGPVPEYWSLNDSWHPEHMLPPAISGIAFGKVKSLVLVFALYSCPAGCLEAAVEQFCWVAIPRYEII